MKATNIRKPAYCMATTDGQSAEITMYGDIYEQRPTDWYGNPVEGQFVLMDEFLDDLKSLEGCKDITIRMNSYGGDAGVSNTIHNRLRELARNGTQLTCIVDGVAMSGGSLIMCACDTVKVNPSSLIMIHKCWGFFWGGYNADELREAAEQYDAWDKAQVAIYKRKTGLTETILSHMMADTTYMTGREAVEKGFADELIEDAEPVTVAASADGRSLYVRGRTIHLARGCLPRTAYLQSLPRPRPRLRQIYSRLRPVDEMEEIPWQKLWSNSGLRTRSWPNRLWPRPELPCPLTPAPRLPRPQLPSVSALQTSMQLREFLTPSLCTKPSTATHPARHRNWAYRAAVKAAAQGQSFLVGLMADAVDSGANGVGAVPPPSDKGSKAQTPEQRMAEARHEVKALLGRKEA